MALTEVLFDGFLVLAIATVLVVLCEQFDLAWYIHFYSRRFFDRRRYRRIQRRGADIVVRGEPGQVLYLDDFRMETSGGTEYVAVSKGTAILPESGELTIAIQEHPKHHHS